VEPDAAGAERNHGGFVGVEVGGIVQHDHPRNDLAKLTTGGCTIVAKLLDL
jgi:hypothetical protein